MNGRVPIVLLIEHDAIQRGTLARLLKNAGYCVIGVGRAHEALETFATHHVDIALVVVDTQASALTGPPLLYSLVTIDPFVPVVVLSAGVAIERSPAYEYSNVAATLIKPFEPAHVLAQVERVLLAAAAHDAARARGAAFNWPPTEEDLADIQVVDTSTWQAPQPVYQLSIDARPSPIASQTVATPDVPLVRPHALVAHFAEDRALVKPAPTMEVARVQQTPPPRLVVHGLERSPFADMAPGRMLRPSARARRSMAVAATALFGLTLTTLLEWKGVPARHAKLAGETATSEVVTQPVLSSNEPVVNSTRLIPAGRVVRPRAVSGTLAELAAKTSARLELPIVLAARRRAPAPKTSARIDKPRDTTRRDAPVTTDTPAPPGLARSLAPAARTSKTATSFDRPRDTIRRDAAVTTGTPAPAALARSVMPIAPAATPSTPSTLLTPSTSSSSVGAAATREASLATNGAAPAMPAAAPNVVRPREDERGIYDVLRQYQRAYERLDVNAARAVWPSLDARALARAFDGLKAQALEFSHCRLAMDTAEATAICGGRASYIPRVGRQAERTEPREWTFRLRKVDHEWQIAKAEVR